MTQTVSDIHDSSTCDLANGAPCEMCAAAIEYETKQVLERTREMLSDSNCDCALHQLSQTERVRVIDAAIDATTAEVRANGGYLLPSFADEWELAPLSQTRYTERENAEFWFERGRLAERARMLLEQNEDMKEMLRVARERITR